MDVGSILNSLIVADPRPSASLVTLLFDLVMFYVSSSSSSDFSCLIYSLSSHYTHYLSSHFDLGILL